MCGRKVDPDEAAMEREWRIDRRNLPQRLARSFNVAPTMQVPIIIRAADGATELFRARWGLVPGWWSKPELPALTFNARSEEAAGKATWAPSLKSMRCLMPSLGWYEWNETERVRSGRRMVNQPYYLHCPDSEVVAIAGLWAVLERGEEPPLASCALLTKAAAPSVARIHHRMPVVLKREHCAAWLDPRTPGDEVQAIIADARQDITGHRVSLAVNDTGNDYPELLAEVEPPSQGALDF